jgi:succinate dehydrogenase / fumarate reductase iron-sulfur subunit
VEEPQQVLLKIKRRESADAPPRWEELVVPWQEGLTVRAALQASALAPVTRDGKATTKVAWDEGCGERCLGACAMIIDGRARTACAARVDELDEPIELRPLEKFPVVRDLLVDRARIHRDLARVRVEPAARLDLAGCTACGCCLEACPSYGPRAEFIGAAAIHAAQVLDHHPSGAEQTPERIEVLLGPGGVGDCGNAQVCVEVCPEQLPLTDSIAEMMRATTQHGLRTLLGRRRG